jgi:hypothetical protein
MDGVKNGDMFQGDNEHYYLFSVLQLENNFYIGAWIIHLVPITLN